MSENDTSDDEQFFNPMNTHVNAVCPHCDRVERFDDELTARAWMTGHIQEEHADELPRYGGAESDQ